MNGRTEAREAAQKRRYSGYEKGCKEPLVRNPCPPVLFNSADRCANHYPDSWPSPIVARPYCWTSIWYFS